MNRPSANMPSFVAGPGTTWPALGIAVAVSGLVALASFHLGWLALPIGLGALAGLLFARSIAALLLLAFPLLNVHHVPMLNVLFCGGGILLLWVERLVDPRRIRIRGLEAALIWVAVLALHPVPFAAKVGDAFGQWVYDYSPLVLFVFVAHAKADRRIVLTVIRALLVAILIASLTVVVDGLLHPATRAVGIVEPMPTGVAYDMVMFVPLGLSLMAAGRHRLLGGVAALSALAAIFFTGSRTPFAAALLVSLPFVRRYRISLPSIVIIMVVAMVASGGGMVSRIASIQAEHGAIDASSLIRIVLWTLSIKIILTQPWLGIGFGQFNHVASQYFPIKSFLMGHSHNMVLEKMVQVGVPLTVFYLVVIALLLKMFWRRYQSCKSSLSDENRQVFLGLFMGALAMLLCGATDAVLNGPNQPLLFWIFMVLIALWSRDWRAECRQENA